MQAKNYEKAVSDAAIKLNEISYLYGDSIEIYDAIERGFVLGIATAFGVDPHSVKAGIFGSVSSNTDNN